MFHKSIWSLEAERTTRHHASSDGGLTARCSGFPFAPGLLGGAVEPEYRRADQTAACPPSLVGHAGREETWQSSSQGASLSPPPPVHSPSSDAAGAGEDMQRTVRLLCCGGLAGAISRTLTAPIDRLKFLCQVHRSSHLTIREGFALMANEKTYKAYFRGNGANVMKNIPETALKLTLNDRIKDKICKGGHHITLGERLTVAALSGAIAQAVIYPLEVIQTRLAATHGVYTGMMDVIASIWQKEGARAFYRGMTPCLIGILPYAGLDITAFDLMKDQLTVRYGGLPPPHMLLACGMLSSSSAQIFAYPFGFVRTRMQMDALSPEPYKNMMDCFQSVVRKEGWRGLYKGFGMSLAKIAPAAGISWFIYEESKALLGMGKHQEPHHR